jgi:beta-aspartyl-dipeptidase (metallo-type)
MLAQEREAPEACRRETPVFTLIEHGDVYTPTPLGVQSILVCQETIARIGAVDVTALTALGLPYARIDATGCIITPGFIDPHQHLIGAAGETGFASRRPEVALHDIVSAGITTVVGCLGTDTVTRHLSALLAKARQLQAQGITAYMYTGGFQVPTPTITSSVMHDLILIDAVIGVGEVAIADVRSSQPSLPELARLVADATVGGMVAGKAGVTHLHVGPGRARLSLLHELLDRYEVSAAHLYATHINRNRELMDDAIALARRGAYVDLDTVEGELSPWLHYYREHDGPLSQLTVSSDAHTLGGRPHKLYQQFVASVSAEGLSLEDVLPLFTCNTARVLHLPRKGRVQVGMDADLLILDAQTLAVVHVLARGRQMLRHGQVVSTEEEA